MVHVVDAFVEPRGPERLSTKVLSVCARKDHLRKWSALRGSALNFRIGPRHHLDDATTKRSIELLISIALACMRWKSAWPHEVRS